MRLRFYPFLFASMLVVTSVASGSAGEEGVCGHHSTRPTRGAHVAGPHALTLEFVDSQTSSSAVVRVGLIDTNGDPIVPDPPEDFFFQDIEHKSFFYVDSAITMNVPDGPFWIHAGKGFEYLPVDFQLALTGDTTIVITLERWIDTRVNGWFPGDTHTHMTHAPVVYPVTAEDMAMIMEAEELHYLNVMDELPYFTGAPHATSTADRTLYFTREFRNPHFGHLTSVGLKTWFQPPTCNILPQTACGRTLNRAIAEQIHAQPGAIMIATHPFPTANYENLHEWPGGGVNRGIPFDLIDGNIDAMDAICYTHLPPPEGLVEYTEALNTGFRLPLSAGTDTAPTSGASFPLGGYRVYAKVGDSAGDFSTENWIEAVRNGATYVSNYPVFQDFSIEGNGIGSVVVTQSSQVSGTVDVRCVLPMDRVEIIADGDVVAELFPLPNEDGTRIGGAFSVPSDTIMWVAARVHGSIANWHVIWNDLVFQVFAQTSPIYIERQGLDPDFVHPKRREGAAYFVARLEQMQRFFDDHGDFPDGSEAVYDSTLAAAFDYYQTLVPDPPEPFSLLWPMYWSEAHGSIVVSTTTPTFRWQATEDPDPGDVVTYALSYGTDSTFSGATVISGLTAPFYEVPPGGSLMDQTTYFWKVEARDTTGQMRSSTPSHLSFLVDVTATAVQPAGSTARWAMSPGTPNPFNPSVRFEYTVPPDGGRHAVEVLDVRGRLIRTLFEGEREAGRYALRWDGRNQDGDDVASGVYFLRLRTARHGALLARKVVLLK